MTTDRMTCMSCGTTKAWPDGFPNRIEATCWQCAWNRHVASEHKSLVRKVRRDVKRKAKRAAERNLMAAATHNELAILQAADEGDA